MALYGMTRNQSSGLGRYAGGDPATQDSNRLTGGSTPTGFETSQTGGGQSGGGDWGNWSGSRSPQTKRDTSPQWSQPNVAASSIYARRPNQATGPSLPDPKIDYDQRAQFNTPQQRMNVTGWGQGSAAQGAYASPAPTTAPAPTATPALPANYTPPMSMYANVNPGPVASPTGQAGSPFDRAAAAPGFGSIPQANVQFGTPAQRIGIDPFAQPAGHVGPSLMPNPADIERARQLALANSAPALSYGGMFAR